MMWQWGIVVIVVLVLGSARLYARIYENIEEMKSHFMFYEKELGRLPRLFKYLNKFFEFLAFKSKLEPTEQAVHYFLGMTLVLPIAKYFALTGAGWYILIALACSVVKETADVVFTGHWDRRDSVVDTAFWMLGGLTTPLLRSFL